MFKRANKVTALLVAAASIMSVVPAMAAEKLSTKDGTVKQGFAFEDGQYGYYGYRTDSDETGIWYNKGGEDKDSAIEDLDEYEYNNASKYGEKYAYALNDSNNDDEYLIDLSTGKVLDDETVEEKTDSARAKLKSALKKAERFNELVNDGDSFAIDESAFERVLTGQFGEVWYRYTTEAAINYKNDSANTTSAGVVFTNDDGKFIDASVTANMRVYSSKKERAIVLEDYDKDYDDAGLIVRLNDIQVLAQDKDNIYTLTKVTVRDSYLKDVIDGKVTGKTTTLTNYDTTQYFIQKISKARGSKEDGSYLPKDVTSYQLDNKTIYDNGDAKDAYQVILGGMDSSDYDAKDNMYAVKDDILYATRIKRDTDGKSDKVKIFKLKLGKVKVDGINHVDGDSAKPVGIAAGIEDIDTNLVKKSGDSDHDTVEVELQAKGDAQYENEIVTGSRLISSAVSIDTAGNTWALDKGKVYQYTGSEWKLMYTVDRNSDALDVYNEGNLMAYEIDGGAYTTVQEGKKVTVEDGNVIEPRVTTPATVGWKQEAAGWTFYDVNGAKTANYWALDNGVWYWIKADGIMATGWQLVNGSWYFLASSGAMQTGWVNDGGTWYYCNASGAMLANTTVDGYVLGASGAWVK